MHIRNRNDLIEWLENNAPFRAIARAMQEGQVENLGAFEHASPRPRPGWIVKVTSRFNKVWYIKIQPMLDRFYYGTVLIEKVPWEFWIGDKLENKLYQGDNPLEYKELRDARKTEEHRSD